MSTRKLYRSLSNRMIAGVCGGLAQYFAVDATLVRFVFLLLLFLGGSGFPLYIILWIIMPDEQRLDPASPGVGLSQPEGLISAPDDVKADTGASAGTSGGDLAQSAARNGPLIFAGILIFLGIWFLLQNLFHIDLGQLWPVMLIIIGLALLIPALRKPAA